MKAVHSEVVGREAVTLGSGHKKSLKHSSFFSFSIFCKCLSSRQKKNEGTDFIIVINDNGNLVTYK